jgi:hypothetical protein
VDASEFRIWHQFDWLHSINRATYWAGARLPKAEWRSRLVVVNAPGFDLPAGPHDGREPGYLQALVAKAAVEALHEAVLHRPPKLDEVEVDAIRVSPVIEVARRELGTVNPTKP